MGLINVNSDFHEAISKNSSFLPMKIISCVRVKWSVEYMDKCNGIRVVCENVHITQN